MRHLSPRCILISGPLAVYFSILNLVSCPARCLIFWHPTYCKIIIIVVSSYLLPFPIFLSFSWFFFVLVFSFHSAFNLYFNSSSVTTSSFYSSSSFSHSCFSSLLTLILIPLPSAPLIDIFSYSCSSLIVLILIYLNLALLPFLIFHQTAGLHNTTFLYCKHKSSFILFKPSVILQNYFQGLHNQTFFQTSCEPLFTRLQALVFLLICFKSLHSQIFVHRSIGLYLHDLRLITHIWNA